MKTAIVYTGTTLLLIFFTLIISIHVSVLSPLFPLRRLDERILLSTKITPQAHAEYLLSLTNQRMEDLSLIMRKKQYPYLLPTSLRYSTTVGKLTAYVKDHNLQELVPKIQQTLDTHTDKLNKLLKQYHGHNQEWKFLMDDVNYISIYQTELAQ